MSAISIEELLRIEVFLRKSRPKDRFHLQLMFRLLLPISFILRLITLCVYKTSQKAIDNQTPPEFLISALSGYFFVSSFICIVSHWIIAIHAEELEGKPRLWIIGILILIFCFIIPLSLIISVFALDNSPENIDNRLCTWIHKGESFYNVILNITVGIIFLVYGGLVLKRLSVLKGPPQLKRLKQKIGVQMIIGLSIFMFRAILLVVRIFVLEVVACQIIALVTTIIGECGLALFIMITLLVRVSSSSHPRKNVMTSKIKRVSSSGSYQTASSSFASDETSCMNSGKRHSKGSRKKRDGSTSTRRKSTQNTNPSESDCKTEEAPNGDASLSMSQPLLQSNLSSESQTVDNSISSDRQKNTQKKHRKKKKKLAINVSENDRHARVENEEAAGGLVESAGKDEIGHSYNAAEEEEGRCI
ncbi:uncharacterized protein MONOS_8476 [Monocercomonoides exilis]|uniref:uncharacterized protein n=1 Tax=Monocercomonoides exilis TaxID=2049356 RepID=UPI00355A4210|nr:hypothetical protein MONOS_8476 [Monocercomonoides exilis]|eukprot:MONOS_8476.1-p1 / transcript=MONOS_8476.1 / gene=MONOS_8476 / organism=Monocercomonoides_exilis_PA203 / gene_product=unspecified product / transcript_product=unspecified product / location=Mono_scaffold00320:47813-49277(-) / protein_length=417 / sequence_SO=supercontig / SO=protein_coding / is_pseudo=false